MACVQKCQCNCNVVKNTRAGFVQKLRERIEHSRREQREIEMYVDYMNIYKQVTEYPSHFTLRDKMMVEQALDLMLIAAVADQRMHRKYAQEASKYRLP